MAGRIKPYNDGPIPKVRHVAVTDRGINDPEYRAWVRSLGCCLTGKTGRVEFHHVTVGRYRMGRRSDDSKGVPVHTTLHSDQHPEGLHNGEAAFWNLHGIDPYALARDLYECWLKYKGDCDFGKQILRAHRGLGYKRAKRWGIKVFDEKGE